MSVSQLSLRVEFDYDFELICMVSSYADYRLCWILNRKFNIDLMRKPDHAVFDQKRNITSYFGLFRFDDEINFLRYFLICNKSQGALLIPELRQIDYFFMMKGDPAGLMKYDVMYQMKNLQGVEAVVEARATDLRSKNNLILE